jgi:hypothetical protein
MNGEDETMKSKSNQSVALSVAILMLVSVVTTAGAQEAPVRPRAPLPPKQRPAAVPVLSNEEVVGEFVRIEKADVEELVSILGVVAPGCEYMASQRMGVVGISGPKNAVSRAVAACAELDVVPPRRQYPVAAKNLQVMMHLLEATGEPGPADAVPERLAATVEELRATFGYPGFRLVDTLLVRCRDREEVQASGFLPEEVEGARPTVQFSIDSVSVQEDEKGELISLQDLVVGTEVHFPPKPVAQAQPAEGAPRPARPGRSVQRQNVGLKTNVDVRPGKQAVVGKANIDGSMRAFFFVIEAEVVE